MADEKVTADGYVSVWWTPLNGVVDPHKITAAEINAALPLSVAIAWQDYSLGATESEEIDDRSLMDAGNARSRGASQYGGTLTFFRPPDIDDANSDYVKAFEAFRQPGVYGYLITRVLQNDPRGEQTPAQAGEWVSVYKFQTDAFQDDTEGDDSVKFTVIYLPQGDLSVYTIVDGAGAVVLSETTLEIAVGERVPVTATLGDKSITQGATWRSSDTDVASVSPNGVITAIGAGTATITADHLAASGSGTVSVTVS